MPEPLFNKVAGLRLQACNFIKKRLWHRCFPMNLRNIWEQLVYRTPPGDSFWWWIFYAKIITRLLVVDYFRKKILSQIFNRDLNTLLLYAEYLRNVTFVARTNSSPFTLSLFEFLSFLVIYRASTHFNSTAPFKKTKSFESFWKISWNTCTTEWYLCKVAAYELHFKMDIFLRMFLNVSKFPLNSCTDFDFFNHEAPRLALKLQ